MLLASLLGGIGTTEILIILAVALLILGPKKLPEIARSIGKGLREFRKSANEFTSSLRLDDEEEGRRSGPKMGLDRADVYARARAEEAAEAAREVEVTREPIPSEPSPPATEETSADPPRDAPSSTDDTDDHSGGRGSP